MNEQVSQLIERLKQAQNVLVTVSKDPSVDQLSAAIGLTLALNALDKHATAVYSGQTPSTIDFLKPEETLEGNTDSLRDFIIALDKSKADKLRYKVEDQVVRIFITPYRTSISEQDLDFSQGDFNVDVVVALGVKTQQDLDDAVQAHGRILHDATVASLSTGESTELGTINLVDAKASSLSEMVTKLVEALSKKAMDGQIATALLTGIVAMTDRFSNDRTTPETMSVSSKLMAAGANQQLIATELAAPVEQPAPVEQGDAPDAQPEQQRDPGMLEIDHSAGQDDQAGAQTNDQGNVDDQKRGPQIHVDENGNLSQPGNGDEPHLKHERIVEPPSIDSVLSANTSEEALSPPLEELTLPSPSSPPTLSHDHRTLLQDDESDQSADLVEAMTAPGDEQASGAPMPAPSTAAEQPSYEEPQAQPEAQPQDNPAPMPEPPMPAEAPQQMTPPVPQQEQPAAPVNDDNLTLSQIEASVHSPHVQEPAQQTESAGERLDDARDALQAAFQGGPQQPEPMAALNAQPLGDELHGPQGTAPAPQPPVTNPGFNEPSPGNTPVDDTLDMPLPNSPFSPPGAQPQQQPQQPMPMPGQPQGNGDQAPPVPPPFVPPLN